MIDLEQEIFDNSGRTTIAFAVKKLAKMGFTVNGRTVTRGLLLGRLERRVARGQLQAVATFSRSNLYDFAVLKEAIEKDLPKGAIIKA